MPNHNYTFTGADILARMASAWFISYLYYTHIDSSHRNWEKVSTYDDRTNKFNSCKNLHPLFVNEIIHMNPHELGKTSIGISGDDVIKMAKIIKTQMGW